MTGARPGEEGNAVLRDTIHEILEPTPCLAKIHRLNDILKEDEYDEGVGQEMSDDDDDGNSRSVRIEMHSC